MTLVVSMELKLSLSDIDQLTRILTLCGTPTQETMDKISSVEVSWCIITQSLLGIFRQRIT